MDWLHWRISSLLKDFSRCSARRFPGVEHRDCFLNSRRGALRHPDLLDAKIDARDPGVVDLFYAAECAGYEVMWRQRQNHSLRHGSDSVRYFGGGWNCYAWWRLVYWTSNTSNYQLTHNQRVMYETALLK